MTTNLDMLNDSSVVATTEEPAEAISRSSALLSELPQIVGDRLSMQNFLTQFGRQLLDTVRATQPPVYTELNSTLSECLSRLKRKPFAAQEETVQAVVKLLLDRDERAAVINAEMGTGKTLMGTCVAYALHQIGRQRCLVLAPPHLVYKWVREIKETVPGAKVWALNGPETLARLLRIRDILQQQPHDGPEFFVLGRVRARLGFFWRPAFAVRRMASRVAVNKHEATSGTVIQSVELASCPRCARLVTDGEDVPIVANAFPKDHRRSCAGCGERLWTLYRPGTPRDLRRRVRESLMQLPTIGEKSADRLIHRFSEEALAQMLGDNVFEFVQLMDDAGNFVFNDRQAERIERALSRFEFAMNDGAYQPTEFIKRYLPRDAFGLLIVDEAHEYKAASSAQGQAMAVLAEKAQKILLLTGTLMGGYADDLFYLLWRVMPQRMMEDGFHYNGMRSLGSAGLRFLERHGILQTTYKTTDNDDHRTSRGKRTSINVKRAPGFGPQGIARYVMPFTAFLKLKQLGENVLPPYVEHVHEISMTPFQGSEYQKLRYALTTALKTALRKGDRSLLGVVLQSLLAWPDTAFREEIVRHPRKRETIAYVGSVFDRHEPAPKELELLRLVKAARDQGRKVLLYTVYTGVRDTATRLTALLRAEGFKVAVLKSTVPTDKREDWVFDQVERGCDVLLTHPDLVKTGLDLLEFPTIVFMQTGYSVYTLQQASRRSWRIGQKLPVDVHFLCYAETSQVKCLQLMAKKIAVSQSTSGDMPESGLDVLNPDADSVEMALARQLVECG